MQVNFKMADINHPLWFWNIFGWNFPQYLSNIQTRYAEERKRNLVTDNNYILLITLFSFLGYKFSNFCLHPLHFLFTFLCFSNSLLLNSNFYKALHENTIFFTAQTNLIINFYLLFYFLFIYFYCFFLLKKFNFFL